MARVAWNKGKTKEDYPQLSHSGVKEGNIPWNKDKKGEYSIKHDKQFKVGEKPIAHKTGCKCLRCTKIPYNKGVKGLVKQSKETIEKRRQKLIGRIGGMTGKKHTEEWKEQHKLFMENQPVEFYRKCLQKRKMSGLEKRIAEIIRQNKFPYKFVGNGEFFIERKNPDFINTNGKKIAIETYYKRHKEQIRNMTEDQWKKERAEIFAKYGWKIIFLEGTNLTNNIIVAALQKGGL